MRRPKREIPSFFVLRPMAGRAGYTLTESFGAAPAFAPHYRAMDSDGKIVKEFNSRKEVYLWLTSIWRTGQL